MNFLDDKERVKLKIQHKKERDGRIRDRIKAVLLHDRGWTPEQIAEALLISDQAVRNHIEEYKASSFALLMEFILHTMYSLLVDGSRRAFGKKFHPTQDVRD